MPDASQRQAFRTDSASFRLWHGQETWINMAVAATVAAAACVVGVASAAGVEASLIEQGRYLHPTPAALVRDASVTTTSGRAQALGGDRVMATVRWKAANGTSHTAHAAVSPRSKAGDATTVRLDSRNRVAEPPSSRSEVGSQARSIGGGVATVICGLLIPARFAVRSAFDRYRTAQWDRERALIDRQRNGPRP